MKTKLYFGVNLIQHHLEGKLFRKTFMIKMMTNITMMMKAESEKPMSRGGIATWKVFARPESFCAYL